MTSFEWMRYCKPHPGFYAQIADELAVAPRDCLMVGNDIGQDLQPAAAVGMRTCLMDNEFQVAPSASCGFTPDFTCTLSRVLERALGDGRIAQ